MEFTAEQQAFINAEIEKAKNEAINAAQADLTTKLEAARREEKEKLYSRIGTLDDELKTSKGKIKSLETELATTKSTNEESAKQAAEIAAAKAAAEEKLAEMEKTKGANSEMSKAMEEKMAKLEELVTNLSTAHNALKAENEENKRRKELEDYRKEKVRTVPASFQAFVKGNTKEEIDAAIELVQKSQADYSKEMGFTPPKPPAESLATEALKGISLEDLGRLDPRSKEYKEMRAKLVTAGLLK